MIRSCASFWNSWMTRVGSIRRSCTLRSRGSTFSPAASGPASAFAAATASWIARLMPTPPMGDIADRHQSATVPAGEAVELYRQKVEIGDLVEFAEIEVGGRRSLDFLANGID